MKEKTEIDLARARLCLKEAEALLLHYRRRFSGGKENLASGLERGMVSDDLKGYTNYLRALKETIAAHELTIIEKEKAVQEKRDELLTKTKKYKVIEKLKEDELKKWKHQQERLEQKRLNEIAVQRHGKRFS